MDPVSKSVQEYIESGEYFRDAHDWYAFKYIYPLTQRSFLLCMVGVGLIILSIIALNVSAILPIIVQVRYSLYTNSYESTANIRPADQIKNNPLNSIADIMIKSYVMNREQYDYNLLKNQFIFVQNNSTRLVFRQFFTYMSIDNPLSPIMRYKKATKRNIEILSTTYTTPGEVVITFHSIAKAANGEKFEDIIWQVTINYNIDDIDLEAASETKFSFAVTNYRLKLIKNQKK